MSAKALPPLPRSVYFPAGRVKVKRVKDLKCEGEKSYGTFEWATRTIEIDARLPLPAAWATLHHEIMHCILADAGIKFADATEELLCDCYAQYRVAEMLR